MAVLLSPFFELECLALFSPDLFSDSHVRFIKTSEQNSSLVQALIESHYSGLGAVSSEVRQSGAIELNSNNFKFEANGRSYILKRIPKANNDLEEKNTQAKCVNSLFGQGLKVPKIQLSDLSDQLVIEHNEAYWCLMNCVQGDYFSGDGAELLSAGSTIVDLFISLGESSEDANKFRVIKLPSDSDLELLKNVYDEKDTWVNKLGRDHAFLLNTYWKKLVKDASSVVANHSSLVASCGVCHIDLHPHNILMSGEQVTAILDFESLLIAPVDVMIFFNLYKLSRQTVVANPKRLESGYIQNVLNGIIADLNRANIIGSIQPTRAILLAKAEVIRRVLIILKLCLLDGVNDWNHVLPVQLIALYEVEILFNDVRI